MNSKKLKNFLLTLLLLCASLTIMLFAAESLLRLFLNPVDFLRPQIVLDDHLGYRISPNSAGHDAWGFRNKKVPEKADIVTLGDSQTYGDGAKATGSWPAQLAQKSGKVVYNLSLGGYGPLQFYYLFNNYALKLHPDTILLGLYCGNDYMDAYVMTYGYDTWAEFRDSSVVVDESLHERAKKIIETNIPEQVSSYRAWLSQHSVLYGVLRAFRNQMSQNRMRENSKNTRFAYLRVEQYGINTGFKPQIRLSESDADDPKIIEGRRITFDIIAQIDSVCRQNNIQFSIVLIPTKELVYAPLLKEGIVSNGIETVEAIVRSDKINREKTIEFLEDKNIDYIDPKQNMQDAITSQLIYHNTLNDHPNENGYGVIAETVLKHLYPSHASQP